MVEGNATFHYPSQTKVHLGNVGSLRIARRCDIDPTSMGFCTMQELPRKPPQRPGDIVLIAKKRMANAEPYAIVVLMTEERARALELGFQQPSGVCERRPLSVKVQKNILTVAPRCLKQGVITQDALSYLTSWSQGDWPRVPRPTGYSHLLHRCAVPFPLPDTAPSWEPPARVKHVDLFYEMEDGLDANASEEEDEGEVGFDAIVDG